MVGDNIRVTLVETRGSGKARIGIDAPPEIIVHRKEVYDAIKRKAAQAPKQAQGQK